MELIHKEILTPLQVERILPVGIVTIIPIQMDHTITQMTTDLLTTIQEAVTVAKSHQFTLHPLEAKSKNGIV